MEMSAVAAQPGWSSVTLKDDQLVEHPVIAWAFEHYDEEHLKRFLSVVGEEGNPLSGPSPITLFGQLGKLRWEAVKDPNGNYWLQGGPLTREETLETLRMLEETKINRRARSEAAE
jgi:hypothetical protein